MAPSFTQAAIFALCASSSAWAFSDSVNGDVLVKRADPVAPTVLPGTWKYQGCYTDGAPRTLTGAGFANETGMTGALCIAYCDNLGFIYSGTEYSQECYCGNKIDNSGVVAQQSDCSMGCKGNTTEACGGPNRLSIYWNGQDPPAGPSTNPGTLGYGLLGCYTEGNGGRALSNAMTVTGQMTVAKCIAACKSGTYSMAGLEYAQECYCGNAFSNAPTLAPEGLAGCSLTCKGNSSEYCGAGNRLDVYQFGYEGASSTTTTTTSKTTTTTSKTTTTTTTTSKTTTTTSKPANTTSPTTTTTSKTTTTTSKTTTTSPTTTTTSKTTTTSSKTTTTTSPTTTTTSKAISSTTTSTSSKTTTTTSASASPTLGYKPNVGAYTRQGCYSEIPNGRALTAAAFYDFDAMTLEKCAASCAAYTYWGVEYGGECYCGNTLNPASTKQLDGDCSFLCPGNSLEYCGAGLRLELYKLTSQSSSTSGGVSSSTTTTKAGSTSSGATTTTTTSPVPSQTGLPTGWKYAGCYNEGSTGRALSYQQAGGATNTVQNCINTCIGLGYSIAGLEYAEQCFCDNFLYNGAAPTNDETKCSMNCAGNANQKCGAGDILSLYYTGNLTAYKAPTPQTDNLPGSWQYAGCWTDSVPGARALPWQTILTNNNSATTCLGLCSKYGYMAGGMQYGEECYCGDDDVMVAGGATLRPDSECQIVCSGNKNNYCGGNNRNSYYKWTGTPLYVWNKPTGNAMGSYQFLVGGVVVPLITTTGINDKIMFMEKSGTGAPNTTGVYELDLASLNDMSKAWRPLHVATDIFCAAGVTLPDKAGRQLNIGGWSGDSTFGVRLYWPDGSPGVWGKNDWTEDNAVIRLREGRWYPSAINLANGTVLVIGGEIGSNSAPTPSLEILPPPPGGYAKYLDWLERTDPNNLYPFLWVLPSGGIFVMYWNEARILDEGTFDTVKTLPNMPGSVNNFLSGRTYPLEGTGVMMPLYSPYTAPATFMACGGSSTGAAEAVDNCVSTQPEVANPTWTIERMPSVRVMSCICALPDGTYLILNGAKAGVAGFGLANTPNFQAVLYDPSKPVNQRMSIMASTIVPRLYHSEAVLMPDGRVLVSGSDPEDGKNPQEYRVEVFNPPYALSGAAPPVFSINNKDWPYGNANLVTITTTVPSGNVGAVRVSMMAAVSSTHGNSLGQRTIFLAAACSGSGSVTCSITTPPSAHVAPPGWYQIFVLDGPRPGRGIWIRIGGSVADIAGIGNWPNDSKFATPGLGAVGT